MGIIEYLKNKKKEKELPLIARVDLVKLAKEREENMELGEKSILARADYTKRIPTIRLQYVALERFIPYGLDAEDIKLGQTYGISSPFRLPKNMSMDDACKVISYLSEKVEAEQSLEPACEESVIRVSNILASYGFERVEWAKKGHYHAVSAYKPFKTIEVPFEECRPVEGITDLITVGGENKMFKRSTLKENYFNWFTENVTAAEIKEIYEKIHRTDLLPSDFDKQLEETEHVEAIPGPAFEISKEAYERMLEDEGLTGPREISETQRRFAESIKDETKGDYMDRIKEGSILLVEKHPDIVRNIVRDDAEEDKLLANFEAGLDACKKFNEDLGERTFDK